MSSLPPIARETLEILRHIPTQTVIDALWVKDWPMTFIHGAEPLQLGKHMAGRAVTLRYVPHRPDLVEDKPKGEQSAEYVAFELCGPEEVLVTDTLGWKYISIGGDIEHHTWPPGGDFGTGWQSRNLIGRRPPYDNTASLI